MLMHSWQLEELGHPKAPRGAVRAPPIKFKRRLISIRVGLFNGVNRFTISADTRARGGKIRLNQRPQPQFWWFSYLKWQYLLSLALGGPHILSKHVDLPYKNLPCQFLSTHRNRYHCKSSRFSSIEQLHGFAAQRPALWAALSGERGGGGVPN